MKDKTQNSGICLCDEVYTCPYCKEKIPNYGLVAEAVDEAWEKNNGHL